MAKLFLQMCAGNYSGAHFIMPTQGLMPGLSPAPGPAGDGGFELRESCVSMTLRPQLQLDVSIIITRFSISSESTRAISRIIVVFPTPGLPSIKMDFPDSSKSLIIEIVPKTARPTRHVNPLIKNCRFLIQLIL